MSALPEESHDILIACVELVGRCGAREFEIAYLHDDVPMEEAGWWAGANYGGHRIIVEDQPSPFHAAQGLAEKILTGAKCKCGKLVALSDDGAMFMGQLSVNMADGTEWTAEEAIAAGQCRWRREGPRWKPGCE